MLDMTNCKTLAVTCAAALALAACNGEVETPSGADAIDAQGLEEHIVTLSSDEFEGRAPATRGGELTVEYLVDQFQGLGLEPANGNSYLQEVPLISMTATPAQTLTITGGEGEPLVLEYGPETVFWTKRVVEEIALEDSELVFVGYGIVAPEYDWNDYEGVDVEGKTVVMLVNDPGYATQDPDLFNGNAMTYYGRWTYKYEEAARQGAAGAIIIHRTGPAGYGWNVVESSWTGAQYDLVRQNRNMDRVQIEGWVTESAARDIFGRAGLSLPALWEDAATREFQATGLGLTASAALANELVQSQSHNVAAVLPGEEAPDEYFIYMAHWDHLGINPDLEGDRIYNGALDNATGTAGLIELAEAFVTADDAPDRSVIFLAVTAEEQGLLGSAYYADNPLVPLARTVAGLNMDGLNYYGPTRDIVVTGLGMSGLDQIMRDIAGEQDRRVEPDPEPEKGYYFRSDHFELAKKGVPMIYPDMGIDHVEQGEEYGRAMQEQYVEERYHAPSDEYDPETWTLAGAVQDLKLFYEFGRDIVDSEIWPEWNEGSAFRAAREASRAAEAPGGE